MSTHLNRDRTVAVDRTYYWQPMDTCPRGVKVQLLGRGGVAVYGAYTGKDDFWTHWAPLPTLRPEDKAKPWSAKGKPCGEHDEPGNRSV